MSGVMERSWWVILPTAVVACGVSLLVAIALVWALPWYGLLSGMFVIGLIAIWAGVVYDLVRRADMALWTKVVWAVVVVLIPLLGGLVYYFSRPSAEKIRYRGEQLA